MGEQFHEPTEPGDSAPLPDTNPEVDANQALGLGNVIRAKVVSDDNPPGGYTADGLLDVAGTGMYRWFEGNTCVQVTCTSGEDVTKLEVTRSTPEGTSGKVSVDAREYELVVGEPPYYDEAQYTQGTTGRSDSAQPGMAPFVLIDAVHDIAERSGEHTLRQSHLRSAKGVLTKCTDASRKPIPEE